jgi:hypothetical protein
MRPDAVSGQMEVEDLGYYLKRFYSIDGNVLAAPGGKYRQSRAVTMRELLSITTENLCDCLWRGGMAEMHRKLKLWTDEDLVDVLRHVFECLLAAS